MTQVHTQYGPGTIIAEDIVRGRRQVKVAGNGFEVWLPQEKVGMADVDFDNSVSLPYDPTPQHPALPGRHDATEQPNQYIDPDKRLHPADSVTFNDRTESEGGPWPKPAPHLFASSRYYYGAEGEDELPPPKDPEFGPDQAPIDDGGSDFGSGLGSDDSEFGGDFGGGGGGEQGGGGFGFGQVDPGFQGNSAPFGNEAGEAPQESGGGGDEYQGGGGQTPADQGGEEPTGSDEGAEIPDDYLDHPLIDLVQEAQQMLQEHPDWGDRPVGDFVDDESGGGSSDGGEEESEEPEEESGEEPEDESDSAPSDDEDDDDDEDQPMGEGNPFAKSSSLSRRVARVMDIHPYDADLMIREAGYSKQAWGLALRALPLVLQALPAVGKMLGIGGGDDDKGDGDQASQQAADDQAAEVQPQQAQSPMGAAVGAMNPLLPEGFGQVTSPTGFGSQRAGSFNDRYAWQAGAGKALKYLGPIVMEHLMQGHGDDRDDPNSPSVFGQGGGGRGVGGGGRPPAPHPFGQGGTPQGQGGGSGGQSGNKPEEPAEEEFGGINRRNPLGLPQLNSGGWGSLVAPKVGSYRPAGLSDKYIEIESSADYYNDPVVQFRHDPDAYISRIGHVMDEGLNPRFAEYVQLVEADHHIREAAWKDVRTKALRLRREGHVHVKDIDHDRIYASVQGDHGTYDTMIKKGGSFGGLGGGHGITNWHCSCEWGKWAFKRRYTYVGRLCSHGYAAYLEMQSNHTKGQPRMQRQTRPPKRRKRADALSTAPDALGDYGGALNGRDGTRTEYLEGSGGEMHPFDVTGIEFNGHPTHGSLNFRRRADALQMVPTRLVPELVVNDTDDTHQVLDVTKDTREDTGPDDITSDTIQHFTSMLTHCERTGRSYPRELVAFLNRYADVPGASDPIVSPAASTVQTAPPPTPPAADLGGKPQANGSAAKPTTANRQLEAYFQRYFHAAEENPDGSLDTGKPGETVVDQSTDIAPATPAPPKVSGPNPGTESSDVLNIPKTDAEKTDDAAAKKDKTEADKAVADPSDPTKVTPSNSIAEQLGLGGAGGAGGMGGFDMSSLGDLASGIGGAVADIGGALAPALTQAAPMIGDALGGIGSSIGSALSGILGSKDEMFGYRLAAEDFGYPELGLTGHQPFAGSGPQSPLTIHPSTEHMKGIKYVDVTDLGNYDITQRHAATRWFTAEDNYGSGEQSGTGGVSSGIGDGAVPNAGGMAQANGGDGGPASSFSSGLPPATPVPLSGTGQPGLGLQASYRYADGPEQTTEDYEISGTGDAAPELNRLRNWAEDDQEEFLGEMDQHIDDLQETVQDARDKGVDASPLVASVRRAGKAPRRPRVVPEVVRVYGGNQQGRPQAVDGFDDRDPYSKTAADFGGDDGGGDIVAQFQRSAAAQGILADSGGGSGGGDFDIAGAAARHLKTAGRNYSIAEQHELMNEKHPQGARNLASLDLSNTHYEAENSVGLW